MIQEPYYQQLYKQEIDLPVTYKIWSDKWKEEREVFYNEFYEWLFKRIDGIIEKTK